MVKVRVSNIQTYVSKVQMYVYVVQVYVAAVEACGKTTNVCITHLKGKK